MADHRGGAIEENQVQPVKSQANSGADRYLNGQCVLSISSGSILSPGFDLEMCRSRLEMNGFQIPESDLEVPLKTALDVPSVKRYITFNSSLFHFLMAPVLYVVLWCAVFSSLHTYITITDYWVLCLCVSLVAIFLTTAIIFILHRSNKKININLDVRLIAVNERLVKHKLLVSVADWVENCTSNLQLYFVYWDMSRCLRALTETLEEQNYESQNIQNKLKKRMSHLVLVSEVSQIKTETEEGDVEQGTDEHRPLLQEEPERNTSSDQKGAHQLTTSLSLVPDTVLSAQVKAQQLLMTYSALYIKLLVSEHLSGPSHYRMRLKRNHCTTASLCLCQFIRSEILR
ncbi:transmembrane protein 268 isoform X2 [Boleophthalmus pectinirostris]|nr:transmembrane protein 268 isoform X2 [Boleophthalmus pectinirostris]XP_020794985.1 transmembrane protein 268 isoform X2 [Boleophthalmus pectinirostris]XP_020794986.1 transmembrane protein 268 isoform X2 [Boleophthalmus pectinirostris]XP_055013161.1 transmembrane protein 268 isoform X2 [Boleophthalmus pectinirostris]XP_055013162.1 transmembrane protein 268 isoform X2 [Boleophthalmus pectinirostris]